MRKGIVELGKSDSFLATIPKYMKVQSIQTITNKSKCHLNEQSS